MRRFALLAALLFLSSMFVVAQSGGDQTPPGGDMVGSTPRPAESQLGEQSRDAAQNQRMTGNMGNTKGYSGDPFYAGSSDYTSRENISGSGAKGQQEYTSTAAGRRRAEDRQNSPYDTRTTASQSYLSGRFGQGNQGQQANGPQRTNAKRPNGKQQPPPKR
ncbi:MAG: hypothetical protein ACRD3E_02170 [Terriglobales bacterium]